MQCKGFGMFSTIGTSGAIKNAQLAWTWDMYIVHLSVGSDLLAVSRGSAARLPLALAAVKRILLSCLIRVRHRRPSLQKVGLQPSGVPLLAFVGFGGSEGLRCV